MSFNPEQFARVLAQIVQAPRVHYLSVPITSGLQEIELLRRYGCGRDQLRRDRSSEFRGVIEYNERRAGELARQLRLAHPGISVINPGGLSVSGWGQADYMTMWKATILGQARALVITDETLLSPGGREEICLALRTGLPVKNSQLRWLTAQEIQNLDAQWREWLAEFWSPEQIEDYVPFIDFAALAPADVADNAGGFRAGMLLASMGRRLA